MPDISMCPGLDCEAKERCYRYKATPSEYRQAYSDFTTLPKDFEGKCEYFSPVWNDDRRKTKVNDEL